MQFLEGKFSAVKEIEFDDRTERVYFTIAARHWWTYEKLNEQMQDQQ